MSVRLEQKFLQQHDSAQQVHETSFYNITHDWVNAKENHDELLPNLHYDGHYQKIEYKNCW